MRDSKPSQSSVGAAAGQRDRVLASAATAARPHIVVVNEGVDGRTTCTAIGGTDLRSAGVDDGCDAGDRRADCCASGECQHLAEELLWGRVPGDPRGLITALPTSKDVLDYPARAPGRGERVQLRLLRIADGVAAADLSRELGAYGGGSLRLGLIDQPFTRTLTLFPSVGEVRIADRARKQAAGSNRS
jgi:hypothetical protein